MMIIIYFVSLFAYSLLCVELVLFPSIMLYYYFHNFVTQYSLSTVDTIGATVTVHNVLISECPSCFTVHLIKLFFLLLILLLLVLLLL